MRTRRFGAFSRSRSAGGDFSYRLVIFILLCVFIVAGLLALDKRVSPAVEAAASAKMNYVGYNALFSSITSILSDEAVDYGDLVTFSYDENKRISAMQVDTVRINLLKAKVSQVALAAINAIDPSEVSVPLGNIIGGDIFIGRGPAIPVRILPVSMITVDILNDFWAAGINQTRHRILLDVVVDITLVTPTRRVNTQASSRLIVTETVIVGDVPSGFTYVIGDKSDTIGIINDYQTH